MQTELVFNLSELAPLAKCGFCSEEWPKEVSEMVRALHNALRNLRPHGLYVRVRKPAEGDHAPVQGA